MYRDCRVFGRRGLKHILEKHVLRGNGHRLNHRMFSLNTRIHHSSVRVTEHWNKWPREVVESPPLEVLKSHLGVILGNLF